ncbi:uncharacterized protein LOC129911413 [Episyrphus balteatus]|uniref:uncharacterized protein LOC129911413 n=1 Tax=Episyrphus balteatus TaxID=286459 RepID=UPI0024869B29|nr:uncharacterized protein LOC129911413 [Episyrphus balteatus]
MVNVIAVFHQNFSNSSVYYDYSNFGNLTISEHIWDKEHGPDAIFPDQARNLNAASLSIIFGPMAAGVIISKNGNSDKIVGGYTGNLFSSFAKRHNITLNISNIISSLSPLSIYEKVLNGTIDMSGSAPVQSIEWFSYPIFVYDWGVMLPVEPNIPIYKVFAFIINGKAFAILIVILILISVLLKIAAKVLKPHGSFFNCDLFFNIDCFRGILAQSFSVTPRASFTTKITYSLIFLLGIMLITSYNAFLQSFMTQIPKEKMIKSFDALQSSGLKI